MPPLPVSTGPGPGPGPGQSADEVKPEPGGAGGGGGYAGVAYGSGSSPREVLRRDGDHVSPVRSCCVVIVLIVCRTVTLHLEIQKVQHHHPAHPTHLKWTTSII
jgi:hypothetical protein